MFLVNNILVDQDISSAEFVCDLNACKGACCTFPGEHGAPVLDSEIELFKQSYDAALSYLTPRSIEYLEEHGFIQGKPGAYYTVCINKKDCVFVYYENEIAFCALEKAYLDGKTKFKKPISCHLFPIRVGDFGGPFLYYERISECKAAVRKGKKEEISLVQSIKEPLVRSYGEQWYEKLIEIINNKK